MATKGNVVTAVDGDRIDRICWRYYGSLKGRVVEQVLDANPGLSTSTALDSGTRVFMPDIEPITLERSLW